MFTKAFPNLPLYLPKTGIAVETLTHAVKPADIATFLGRKLNGNYQGEMGNRVERQLELRSNDN